MTRFFARTVVVATGLLAAIGCQAHDASSSAVPDDPGVQVGGAIALSLADARDPWPAARLPGVFGNGSTPVDRRGGALEHATVEIGARWTPALSATAAWGFHDSDPPHVEAAWVSWEQVLGDDLLALGAGRNRLPMGRILMNGGHFDRFGAMPLAKRAVTGDDWIDDGVSLRWQPGHDGALAGLDTVTAGIWRARSFPGGPDTAWAPALHARATLGSIDIDGFISSVAPPRRGAYIQNSRAAHTHDEPDCRTSLVGITCFDGRSDLLAFSIGWDLPWPTLRLESAMLLRRDRGVLFSASGEARYAGSTGGGWVDMIWTPSERHRVSLRAESVRSVQSLTGVGALAVATDAGLLGSTRIWRATAAASRRLKPGWLVSLEAGADAQGSHTNPFAALRLLWTPDRLGGWSW